jgi:hypothetical protein
VSRGDDEVVDLSLRLGPLDHGVIDYEWHGWAKAVASSDLIAHVRIEKVLDSGVWPSSGCGCDIGTEYQALAVSLNKLPTASRRAGHLLHIFLQFGFSSRFDKDAAPKPGDEFVALLQWDSENQRFTTGELSLMVPIRGGKVAWPHGSDRSVNGRRVEDLLARLRRYKSR